MRRAEVCARGGRYSGVIFNATNDLTEHLRVMLYCVMNIEGMKFTFIVNKRMTGVQQYTFPVSEGRSSLV